MLSEGETEAWGLEPYEIGDVDRHCKALVHKGIVRVADIKFPLPYRPNSFSHVLVSDAFDYLSPKYMNKTLPELARVSADGIIIFAGSPGQRRAKIAQFSKFGRPVSHTLQLSNAFLLLFSIDWTSIASFKCLNCISLIKIRRLPVHVAAPKEILGLLVADEVIARESMLLCRTKAKMRSPSWWKQFFTDSSIKQDESASKKFEQAASKMSFKPTCQVFHLSSYR
ncbi:hypothetical protein V8G54_001565 [Vigna mungo]|uniref:Uncharacterized protein n=1 Tax=Vigna mungo TaxID=3915 RepID=A0AAQ3P6J9_VIGMU